VSTWPESSIYKESERRHRIQVAHLGFEPCCADIAMSRRAQKVSGWLSWLKLTASSRDARSPFCLFGFNPLTCPHLPRYRRVKSTRRAVGISLQSFSGTDSWYVGRLFSLCICLVHRSVLAFDQKQPFPLTTVRELPCGFSKDLI